MKALNETTTLIQPGVESVHHLVDMYAQHLVKHPIADLCLSKALPEDLCREFARIQFVDSILWVPMLSLIKGKVKSPRLLRAVLANMMCEAGVKGKPHTTLCQEFLLSMKEPVHYGSYETYSPLSSFSIAYLNGLVHMSEAEIAGSLFASEALVPIMFQVFRPAFLRIPDVDFSYLDEHIQVDSDEHAKWMAESIAELVLRDARNLPKVVHGVHLAARATLAIPDALYFKVAQGSAL